VNEFEDPLLTEILAMDPLRLDGVTSPANGTEFLLMKAQDETPRASYSLIKAVPEHQFTLGLAYPANRPDIRRAKDGHIDIASAEVVEKAAWSWMAKSQAIGLFHAGEGGQGRLAESYIHRGPDWETGNTTIRAGDWLVGVIWEDPAWSLVKSGQVRGFSPQGFAQRAPTAKPGPTAPYGVPDLAALKPVTWQ
jgi:hypothetical protein